MTGSFGLKPPAPDDDTRAWLRLKGIRDVVSGLVVLAMMLTADRRLVGIALLVEAVVPLGDMSIILGSGGSKAKALLIHGVTCAVMLVVGVLSTHTILREMPLTAGGLQPVLSAGLCLARASAQSGKPWQVRFMWPLTAA